MSKIFVWQNVSIIFVIYTIIYIRVEFTIKYLEKVSL